MRQRLISAAVLVPLVVLVYVAGPAGIWLALAILAALSGMEAGRLIDKAGLGSNRAVVAILPAVAVVGLPFVALPGAYGAVARHDWMLFAPAVAVSFLAVAAAGLATGDPRRGAHVWIGSTFASLYASLLAFAAALAVHDYSFAEGLALDQLFDGGRLWLLALVLTVWSLDSVAYFIGRYVPRGRFFNHISPNKSWSGAIGGTVAGVAVCTAVLVFGLGIDVARAELIGLAVAVAAQAGDLAESMLKRAAGAKDSGNAIPGHGGVLDRVDSFLFAGPVMFLAFLVVST